MKNILLLFFKRIIISFALILVGQVAFAQTTFTVKLKLIDEKTSEPVSYATASLTVKGETTAAKYVLTDADGVASLSKVKKGTYVLKAELMGYNTHQQEITIEKNVDLGQIKMTEDVKVLDAASVSAVGNPIVVKKDTVEYSASSFKTSDNDRHVSVCLSYSVTINYRRAVGTVAHFSACTVIIVRALLF